MSDPGLCRPQRKQKKIYTHFRAGGYNSSDSDALASDASSASDSEQKDTSECEHKSLLLNKTKRKTKNSKKTSSTLDHANKIHQSNLKKLKNSKKVHPKIVCSICNLNISQDYMRRHIKHMHPEHELAKPRKKVGRVAWLFQCDLCPRKFKTKTWLENHILQFHVVDKSFECGICVKSFLTKELLETHVKRVHEETNFKCMFCFTKSIQDSASLKKHIETAHKGYTEHCDSEEATGNNHICPVCDTLFLTNADLVQHLKIPESKSVMKCELCSQPVHTPCRLNLHRKKMHSKTPDTDASHKQNELKGIVESCDAKQELPPEKTTKISASVTNQASSESFSCVVCSAVFSRRCDLDFHVILKKHRRWKCPVCTKLLTSKDLLKDHIQTLHSDARPFKCTHEGCSQNFKVMRDLNHHMFTHDPNRIKCNKCCRYIPKKIIEVHVSKCRNQRDETFQCDVCSKKYRARYHLKAHLLSHTGERPFPCKFCDVKYKSSGDATRHMKICEFLSDEDRKQFAIYSNARSATEKEKRKKLEISQSLIKNRS